MRRAASCVLVLLLGAGLLAPAHALAGGQPSRLISDLSAAPSPFYPLIQDGFKDRTKIGYSLSADTDATVVHVYKDDAGGRCCGAEIRSDDLGPRAAGAHTWTWDGTKGDGSSAWKGTYFVRIEATDQGAVTRLSKPQKVEIATGWVRRTGIKKKSGSTYASVTDEEDTALGGDCSVGRDTTAGTAKILCANAKVTVGWKWSLKAGQRIESVSFAIDGGYYGCHKTVSHTSSRSYLHVYSPPTSTCTVRTAKLTYSYLVEI